MTLSEIRRSDKAFLIPRELAETLQCDPHYIRVGAADGSLPFPYIRCGNRTKIPREAFLAWMDGRVANEKSAPLP